MKVAITGANSAVGLALLARVAEMEGVTAIACVRSERAASVLPDHPRIHQEIISYNNAKALAGAMKGADCVVHLAGILIEAKGTNYKRANIDATRSVVSAAERAGAAQVIFVSALGADPKSSNTYLRSKGRAEEISLKSKVPATIIRTPILLGPGTAGSDSILRVAAQPNASLLGGGRHHVRPLDIQDLSSAILKACSAKREADAVFELVGPQPIAYGDLIRKVAELQGNDIKIGNAPIWLAKLGASARRLVTRSGISSDVIDVITADEQIEHNADRELEIQLTPLDVTLENMVRGAQGQQK